MFENLTPRQFFDRRTAGESLVTPRRARGLGDELAPVPSPHLHIPMGQVEERLGELDPKAETVVICRSGGRSAEVARFLVGARFRSCVQPRRQASWRGPGTSIRRSLSTRSLWRPVAS